MRQHGWKRHMPSGRKACEPLHTLQHYSETNCGSLVHVHTAVQVQRKVFTPADTVGVTPH